MILLMIGLAIIKGLAEYTQAYLMAYVGLSVIKNLRDTIYAHLQTLSASFFT